MIRVLGIDPGSRIMGYGLVDIESQKEKYVASGCIKLDPKIEFITRIGQIFPALQALLLKYQPNYVAIEEVFFAKNVMSALKLGQARGVSIAAVHTAGLPIFEYSAREVKLALVGKGGASKDQVSFMVQHRLQLKNSPQIDAGDALAIALCHVQHMNNTLEKS